MKTQIAAIVASVPQVQRAVSRFYHELEPDLYSATSTTFIGRDLQAARPEGHRRRGRQERLRLPAALGGVHRRREPAADRPRRHGLLRPDGGEGGTRGPAGARSPRSRTAASSPSTTTSPRAGARGSSTSCGGRRRLEISGRQVIAARTAAGGDRSRAAAAPRARAGARRGGLPRRARCSSGCSSGRCASGSARSRVGRCRTCRSSHVHSHLSPTDYAILWQLRAPRVVLGAARRRDARARGRAPTRASSATRSSTRTCSGSRPAPASARRSRSPTAGERDRRYDLLPLAAFVGALVAVALAYVLGRSAGGGRSPAALVLAGVTVAAFLTAIQTFVQQQHSAVAAGDLQLDPRRLRHRRLARRRCSSRPTSPSARS